MKSIAGRFVFVLMASLTAGCGSGGSNDVVLVGDDHGEDPGPKGPSGKLGSGSPGLASTVGTLAALCVQACSHLRAANCVAEPASEVDGCLAECAVGPSASRECDDELAGWYQCIIGAAVSCSYAGMPKVECSSAEKAYQGCLDKGSSGGYPGCNAQPQNDYHCGAYYGLSGYAYYQCSSYASPHPSCVSTGSMSFCCP
jgi:hypothetical protein